MKEIKKQRTDELNQKIQGRPSLNQLTERGIITAMKIETDSNVKDKLEHKLNERPSLNQIAESGKMDPREFFFGPRTSCQRT